MKKEYNFNDEEDVENTRKNKEMEVAGGIVDNIKNFLGIIHAAHPKGPLRDDFGRVQGAIVAGCAPFSEESITNCNNVAGAIGCSRKLVTKWYTHRKKIA